MSALSVTVQALRAMPHAYTSYWPGPVTVEGQEFYSIEAVTMPSKVAPPFITVNLISGEPETDLKGQTGMFESRVSIECVGISVQGRQQNVNDFLKATEALVRYLNDLGRCRVGNYQAQFWKQVSDITEVSDEDRLLPRRVLDYVVRWRRLPA